MRWGWLIGIVAALVAAPVHGAPDSWAEGLDDVDDGATRDFYNRGALLPWRQLGGDWVDRSGAEYGDDAYATANVEDTNTAREIVWDITELAQAWAAGDLINDGVMLRAVGGGGPAVFATRESATAGERPRLAITVGGQETILEADADTYLEPSTYQQQGEGTTLRVATDNTALVRFDLADFDGDDIEAANLLMFTTEQFGSVNVGVFAVDPGRSGNPPPREDGFAAEMLYDEGIADHPDVIMFDDFESDAWMDNWSEHGGTFEIIDGGSTAGFEPLLERAVQITIPQGENTGYNTSFYFMEETGDEPLEIYFRYYLRLGDTWDQSVDGGKLPGVAGTYGVAGWGGRKSDGTNGWSARGLFSGSVQNDGNPLAGFTPIGSYVYHADMPGTYGDNWQWNDGWGSEGYGGVLEPDRWYCVEHYVQMNTLGENDGVIRGWIDGRLSVDRTDVRYRDVDNLKIERIWMNIYHGGTDVSPYDQHAFIDNVVIASSYIGPMGMPEPPGGTDGGTESDGDGDGDGTGDGDSADSASTADSGSATSGGSQDESGGSTAGSGDDDSGGCGCSRRSGYSPAWFLLALAGLRRRK